MGATSRQALTTPITTSKSRWPSKPAPRAFWAGRAFWKEYFLQDGRTGAQPIRRDHCLQARGRRQYLGSRARQPLDDPLRFHERKPGINPRHRRLACPLWLAPGLNRRLRRLKTSPGRSLLSWSPQPRHISQPPLRKHANAHGLATPCTVRSRRVAAERGRLPERSSDRE